MTYYYVAFCALSRNQNHINGTVRQRCKVHCIKIFDANDDWLILLIECFTLRAPVLTSPGSIYFHKMSFHIANVHGFLALSGCLALRGKAYATYLA